MADQAAALVMWVILLLPQSFKQIPKVSDFYVDLMLPKKEVDKLVTIGDPVTLIQSLEQVGEHYTGKAMDDRVSNWVAINTLRKVGQRSPYDIYYVATVQEEVGIRGAGPSAFGIDPDIGIALDVTLACDTPEEQPSRVFTERMTLWHEMLIGPTSTSPDFVTACQRAGRPE